MKDEAVFRISLAVSSTLSRNRPCSFAILSFFRSSILPFSLSASYKLSSNCTACQSSTSSLLLLLCCSRCSLLCSSCNAFTTLFFSSLRRSGSAFF